METNQTAPPTDPAPEGAQGDSAQTGPSVDGAVGSAPAGAPGGAGTGSATGSGAGRGTDGRADAAGGPYAATPPDTTGPGFYAWLRRLGLPRRAGWLGGVCAGIGARLGIDPIIVRGIVVVVAVLGAPFVLLYAIAWLLLPDTDGRIHLEQLTRGVVDPAIVGIAVMAVLGFIPLVQGGWLGWQWWDADAWPSLADPIFGFNLVVPLRIIWTLLVVGGIVALVIWLVRRSSTSAASSPNPPAGGAGARTASAADAARSGTPYGAAAAPAPVPPADGDTRASGADAASADVTDAAASADVTDAASATPADGSAPTAEPPVPAMGADAAAIAEWREQHEAWRIAHTEWKAGQDEAMRAAKAQAAAENREKARALAAQADAARVARRASRPRASAAFVFTMLGVSLIGGAVAALWALGSADVAAFAVPIALAVATLALALGMVVAALRRRRSGALAFFTSVSALAMLTGVLGASFGQQGLLIGPSTSIELSESQQLVQPIGDAYLTAFPLGDAQTPVVELVQGVGDAWINVQGGATVLLDASEAGDLDVFVFDADGGTGNPQLGGLDRSAIVLGGETGVRALRPGEQVDARLDLTQRTGDVHIQIME
ncbi:phage shock protein C (PspC) family protein [Agromyces sp. CF514]|uniref:PspC domain-containing protein n=1 Tax=Agromyces sp. CF514 TaxID=1881031 RepID=UPI0008E3067F|nr:PspC domain-containing protein [Agromyces sp. CF514]SFR69630.1 phage shock protein C (PspC) family protein [Agromyces sp. CF514]